MTSHADIVLSAILNKNNPRRDLLSQVAVKLEREHFYGEAERLIYQLLVRYYDRTGEVIPAAIFAKALESQDIDAAKVLAYTQKFKNLQELGHGEADFKWSVQELREEQARRLTGVAITEAMEILERGYEVGKDFLKGHDAAREFLSAKISEIGRLGATEQVPEGDIMLETADILADYEQRKRGERGRGVRTGVASLDTASGGFQKGELVLMAGSAGTGKTQLVTQTCWSAAVEQGLNVFLATSETTRDQVIRRMISRHTRLPQFGIPDRGINSRDIKLGQLTPSDEEVFKAALDDWQNNPAYGRIIIVQIPKGATLSYFEAKLREYGREYELGFAAMDYLALLKSEVRRNSEREELNEIIKGAKLIATSYNSGEGIPLVSPWQINREGQNNFEKSGYLNMRDLSDTSEAEKSADDIIGLIRAQDNKETIKAQWLKLRDDGLPPITELAIDFRNSYFGSVRHASTVAPLLTTVADDDLMSLLG